MKKKRPNFSHFLRASKPSIHSFYGIKKRRSMDFEALQLRNVRSRRREDTTLTTLLQFSGLFASSSNPALLSSRFCNVLPFLETAWKQVLLFYAPTTTTRGPSVCLSVVSCIRCKIACFDETLYFSVSSPPPLI